MENGLWSRWVAYRAAVIRRRVLGDVDVVTPILVLFSFAIGFGLMLDLLAGSGQVSRFSIALLIAVFSGCIAWQIGPLLRLYLPLLLLFGSGLLLLGLMWLLSAPGPVDQPWKY